MENDNFFSVLKISIAVRFFNLKEFFKSLFLYYRSPLFFALDMCLLLHYFFKSPYRICEEEFEKNHINSLVPYGETPFTVLDHIARECGITKDDTVFELGCGRGRCCFWLNHFIGCKVRGIDLVPLFIKRAEKLKRWFSYKEIKFACTNLTQDKLQGATYLYMYTLTLDDEEIRQVAEHVKQCPGIKIITVSFSLKEYVPDVRDLKQFEAVFPWGKTAVYLSTTHHA
jgi:SAM-dependent methyltransferase